MECVKKNRINDTKWITIVLVAVIILWRISFLNKGIDYTDTGFSLVNYHNVFVGDGIHDIGLFITTLLGGVIYNSLTMGQLLAFRILHWVIGLGSILLSYLIFRPYNSRNTLLSVLLILSFSGKGGEALFNYYVLTTFLLLFSVFLLHKGLVHGNRWLLLFSGIISGINIFVRLPNVLFLIIGLGVFLYGKCKDLPASMIFHSYLSFLFGALIGLSLDLILMAMYLTPMEMLRSFINYVNLAMGRTSISFHNFLGIEETQDAHSMTILLRLIVIQFMKTLLLGTTYVAPPIIIYGVCHKLTILKNISSCILRRLIPAMLSLLYCICYIFVFKRFVVRNMMLLLYLYMLIICLFHLYNSWMRHDEYVILYGIALMLIPCTVFGSDLGLYRIGIIQYYLVPLAILPLTKNTRDCNKADELIPDAKSFVFSLQTVCLIVIVGGVLLCNIIRLPNTYMDASFNQLTQPVHDTTGLLKGMCTSAHRAQQLEEYQQVMNREELLGKQVAVFGYFPLGLILGSQKNYFSVPCVDYPSCKVKSLLMQIDQHCQNGDDHPIIVISYVNQLQRHDDHYTSPAKMAVIQYMLSLADYHVFHQSENFTIYVPGEKS